MKEENVRNMREIQLLKADSSTEREMIYRNNENLKGDLLNKNKTVIIYKFYIFILS